MLAPVFTPYATIKQDQEHTLTHDQRVEGQPRGVEKNDYDQQVKKITNDEADNNAACGMVFRRSVDGGKEAVGSKVEENDFKTLFTGASVGRVAGRKVGAKLCGEEVGAELKGVASS